MHVSRDLINRFIFKCFLNPLNVQSCVSGALWWRGGGGWTRLLLKTQEYLKLFILYFLSQVCVWVTAVVDRLVVRNSALSDVR